MSRVFFLINVHWAHGIEDANTLRLMRTIIYSILPLRGLCYKGTLLKRMLKRTHVEKKKGLCNNRNNYKLRLTNINKTLS